MLTLFSFGRMETGKTGEAFIDSIQHIIGTTIRGVNEVGKNLEDGVKAVVIGILFIILGLVYYPIRKKKIKSY